MISSYSLDEDILLPVYKEYLIIFDKCEKISDPYLNLMGLVFHEAMFITSTFIYSQYWLDNIKEELKFPFLGYRNHKFSSLNKVSDFSIKRNLISKFNQIINKSNYTVGIINPSLDMNSLIRYLYKENLNFNFPQKASITIFNFKAQLDIITKSMESIWFKYNIKGDLNIFINAIKKSYNSLKEPLNIIMNYDVLLIGSPVKIPIRAEAAKALANKIPVVCIDHGNETGTANHPYWGYDEQSYCSHFVGYGSKGKIAIKKNNYLKSLFSKNPAYIESNSNFILNNYKEKEIKKITKPLSEIKLAYIPSALMGVKRLGPYNSISDQNYIEWQKYLFNSFRNLVYKAHPKQKIDIPLKNIEIINIPLEKCINKYDCFITDMISTTAFSNLAISNKPIIYFNIGFGKLTKEAERVVKDRVLWININIDDPGDIYQKVEARRNKKFINNYTRNFSLTNSKDSREKTVVDLLKSFV
tara:strand:- start:2312 stop:3724 length:1413 start_codon:yes stop_codon:yes gene_type:complete